MAGKQFGEGKSIKISKASWKLLRARSVDLERPMTALVEEAVVAYLGQTPTIVRSPEVTAEIERRTRWCPWCTGAVPLDRGDSMYCSPACQTQFEALHTS